MDKVVSEGASFNNYAVHLYSTFKQFKQGRQILQMRTICLRNHLTIWQTRGWPMNNIIREEFLKVNYKNTPHLKAVD